MYRKLSDGTECRVKWASYDTPYIDIGPDRFYFNKKDLIEFSDMLNIFIKEYWDEFSPSRMTNSKE